MNSFQTSAEYRILISLLSCSYKRISLLGLFGISLKYLDRGRYDYCFIKDENQWTINNDILSSIIEKHDEQI